MKTHIVVRGACEHNLKNVSLTIPRNEMVVFCGKSGSGKSSLAFDTIFAEGQRRYMDSLSSYVRQFLDQLKKPDVEYIEGLSPSIAIEQKTSHNNPRSTVGTVTEIYDYLRLLFARLGTAYCPDCHEKITGQSIDQILSQLSVLEEGTRLSILSPVVRDKKGESKNIFEKALRDGFQRVRVDGVFYRLDEEITLDKNQKHHIEIVVDRLKYSALERRRLTESIETALLESSGYTLILVHRDPEMQSSSQDEILEELFFSQNFACPRCGRSFPEVQPRLFSFNNPHGACTSCNGLGMTMEPDLEKILPDKSLSFNEGALAPWPPTRETAKSLFRSLGEHLGFTLDTPFHRLSPEALEQVIHGTHDEITITYENAQREGYFRTKKKFPGLIDEIKRHYTDSSSDQVKEWYSTFMRYQGCPLCMGKRLRQEALSVVIAQKSIYDLSCMSVGDLLLFFQQEGLFEGALKVVAAELIKEISNRLLFLESVGLDYLTLSRNAATLSGGESQRIRLATQIGSALVGVLYVLDEPTIGLHERDNEKLIRTLLHLRDLGNTLIVVEHDERTLASADYLVEIGPGAGEQGGEIVFAGTYQEMLKSPESLTGRFLSGAESIPRPAAYRKPQENWLSIRGARENNLKNIDVSIPLGLFTVFTGVSGSGKSTLLHSIIAPALSNRLLVRRNLKRLQEGDYDSIDGFKHIDKIVQIDQKAIGRTPKSNPATYIEVFGEIRDLFAALPEAKARAYTAGRFSFNVKGGRCERCQGEGELRIEMHFLSDVYVTCDVCNGRRFNRETLEVLYKGKNIYDVLQMSIDEAVDFFEAHPKIKRKMDVLQDVGLGYVRLGQSSLTLSGGEAQRVKLAYYLSKRSTGQTFYIIDEPTTGLHFADIKKLVEVLHWLVDRGNTVVLIEHNMDIIKQADYIIDLGPEGGHRGGEILVSGNPQDILSCERSYTAQYLRSSLS